MPFVLRVTDTPSLNRLLELEQIVVVDKTGPAIPLGVAPGAVALIGEFLKGPFLPAEVTSTANLLGTYGPVSNLLSQAASGVQDGSGVRYEGNGMLQLIGKRFQRLIVTRTDNDMTKTDGGTEKVFVKFVVLITTADQDPLDSTKTGKDILIPAGTRFADDPASTATYLLALSQDVLIPRGSTITAGKITIAFNLVQDTATGQLRLPLPSEGLTANTGATAFFVKATSAASGTLDTALDTTIPNVTSVISATNTDISVIDSVATGTTAFAAGTAGAVLSLKNESRYSAAIDKTRPTQPPQEDIMVIWAARRGQGATGAALIRNPLEDNAINSSSEGRGRVAIVSGPRVGTVSGDAASVAAALTEVETVTPLEGTGRSDRKIVTFPYRKVFSTDLNKNVLIAPDGDMAVTLSNFPEEKNPGARNEFIQSIQGLQDEFVTTPLAKQDYINLKAKGVAALRKDRAVGWQFQSGVTSVDPVVDPTRAPIKRRRMADFIQDTLTSLGARYNKEPATTERVDQLVGEIDGFLSLLKSPPSPSQQRIEDYTIDAVSGNTPQLEALGIFTIIVKVRLLASMDTLVFQTTIGETVEIQTA